MKLMALVLATCCLAGGVAGAETLDKRGRFNGITLEYRVVLPAGYDPSRAYLAIIALPPGGLFFERPADRAFPAFLDRILKDYKIQGGKFHIVGNSNGGLSAFHSAALYPQYFISVTGYPGLLEDTRAAALAPLKPLCISMWVGELDTVWRTGMEQQAALLKKNG